MLRWIGAQMDQRGHFLNLAGIMQQSFSADVGDTLMSHEVSYR